MPSRLNDIPVQVQSGSKYRDQHGTVAIKDGIKKSNIPAPSSLSKPDWLKVSVSTNPKYIEMRDVVHQHRLSTVCEEAKCPNISECWSHGTATIMLMGSVCTRACRFCSVDTGNPRGWLDKDEPDNAAQSIAWMNLQYIVLTSVDRDDLPDGGAAHYAQTVQAIKRRCPDIKIEALAPDFSGNRAALATLLDSGIDVFAQNVETVERLTHAVRDKRAGYWQSIDLLRDAKKTHPDIITKTSLMLGLGETEDELLTCMRDLREANVDVLTLGQYLQPTAHHHPIVRYVTPAEFERFRLLGLEMGFFEVASGPMVRSSYRADRIFSRDNLGL